MKCSESLPRSNWPLVSIYCDKLVSFHHPFSNEPSSLAGGVRIISSELPNNLEVLCNSTENKGQLVCKTCKTREREFKF